MITKKPMTKVRMIPMWFGKDKNGYKYLRGKLSDLCSMTVFFEYGLSDGSRVYNVYLGAYSVREHFVNPA